MLLLFHFISLHFRYLPLKFEEMANKPSIPKGTRDFGPVQMAKRNYIFNTVKGVFEKHGFSPIETPAMELRETLTGKYGDEGDQLLFRIMPRGQKVSALAQKIIEAQSADQKLVESSADEALRYDLTVPFARFVVQHQNELSFPFKRYQIQPVWRADRPQKGRYREFYQCDVDIIGSESLLNEVDLILTAHEVYAALGLPDVTIKLNNRKVLMGLAEVIGKSDQMVDLTIALDKLDKLPQEKVLEELTQKGFSDAELELIKPVLNLSGSNEEKLSTLKELLSTSEVGMKGIEETETVLSAANKLGVNNVSFEVTLARGLNYYTGAIFEVTHPDFPSSITGGGRYDDLTGIFGLKGMSGVGISFGADRIYDLLEAKDLFPEEIEVSTELLFVNFGDQEALKCIELAHFLRQTGVRCEVYPDSAKLKKQMKYANDKNVLFVAMLGSDELQNGTITLKNMTTGDQENVEQSAIAAFMNR